MKIQQLRIGMAILMILAIALHKMIIPPYLIALTAMMEFLNYRKEFRENTNHQAINLMSFGFILIIFLNRIRTIHFSLEIEVPVNIVEHFLFSLMFCVVLWEIMKMKFVKPMGLARRLLLINLIFFAIGIGNEVYQYSAYPMVSGGFHFFLLDAIKDILVNAGGALLFTILVAAINRPDLPFVKQFILEKAT